MMRIFVGQLPAWARRDHPALRYELGLQAQPPARARYLRAFFHILAVGVLLVIGYLVATDLLRHAPGTTPAESIFNVLYVPTLALQVLLGVTALANAIALVPELVSRSTWDNLRATQGGVELAMRARWVAILYRQRGLLGLVIAVRVILIGLMLWELTAFQGRYLDLLINGITPEIALPVAVILLSFTMTAALLMPVTTTGLDASVGLLTSAYVRGRTSSSLVLLTLTAIRIGVMSVLLIGGARFMNGELLSAADAGAWLLLGGGALGDLGVGFLHLGRYSEMWATVPYGVFLGTGLLVFSLVQSVIADRLLVFAARRAQSRG